MRLFYTNLLHYSCDNFNFAEGLEMRAKAVKNVQILFSLVAFLIASLACNRSVSELNIEGTKNSDLTRGPQPVGPRGVVALGHSQ